MKNKLSLNLLALVAVSVIPAQAATIITSHGTVSGADDANQAGPILGMSQRSLKFAVAGWGDDLGFGLVWQ